MKNKTLLLFFLFFIKIFPQSATSLILSEVMFNPQSSNNEFIELYNISETESIDLTNFRIKYASSNDDILTSTGTGTIIAPNSFAVILEGDYDFNNGIYSNVIPDGTLLLKISDNSFGTSGMANTSDRIIKLINAVDDTLDQYTYSADNAGGFSDEKILFNKDTSSSGWSNSLVPNGTPGFKNSVSPVNFDLALTGISISPEIPFQGDNIIINSVVKNIGENPAENFNVTIYNDLNFNMNGDENEIIKLQDISLLDPGDSLVIGAAFNYAAAGSKSIISKINFTADEDTTDNELIFQFMVLPPGNNYNDLVLNEIMYAPSSGEPEWIEIYNRSSSAINLKKWKFSDNSSSVVLTNEDKFIEPGSFFVLSRDSSIKNYYSFSSGFIVFNLPSLNNTGDAVVIYDSLNILIDSLSYTPDWGGTGGRSIERISTENLSSPAENWGTSQSIFKATPGSINSLTPKNYDLKISSFSSLLKYGITGEPAEFKISIKNNGILQTGNYDIKIFYDENEDSVSQAGELILQLNGSAQLPADSIEYKFIVNNFAEGMNLYISVLNFTNDEDSTNNIAFANFSGVTVNELRNDLIINEIMYAPSVSQPEWIEIYNKSEKIINLNKYKIGDNSDTMAAVKNNLLLSPGDFLIISSDSTIKKYYNILSDYVISDLPLLNNTGDKIILLDSLNRIIDSLFYSSAWGGTGGTSLEKKEADFNSADSLSWRSSVNKYKATPGYINSVTQKDFDLQVTDLVFNPAYPVYGNQVNLSLKVKNNGKSSTSFSLLLFEDSDLDSAADIELESLHDLILSPGDSAIYSFSYLIQNISKVHSFYSRADSPADQDTSNNYLIKYLVPGYPPSTVLINEVMFNPANGEPEWVEVFNNSGSVINLEDWKISDVVTTPFITNIPEIFLNPYSYLVLTRDSSILNYHRFIPSEILKLNLPVFNNDADGVVLKDNRGITIDSLLFSNEWGGANGYSLERLANDVKSNLQSNWASSADIELSTPGRINSVTPKTFDLSVSEVSFEPRFPVEGDDVFISAEIKNYGASNISGFSVLFFAAEDSTAELYLNSEIKDLNLTSADSVGVKSLIPIKNINQKILAGVKVVFENDEDTLNNYVEKYATPGSPQNVLLINEIMYNPSEGEPEWLELINVSDEPVNLSNWSVSDLLSSPLKNIISNKDLFIEPGEYFILARDTSFYSFYPEVETEVMVTNFGSLGNSEDGLIIYDFREAIIDSILYNSAWGGKKGYSLERLSLSSLTNDSSNWATSLSKNKSTPGASNSLLNVPSYQKNSVVINEIMFDPDIDNNEFIEIINLSNDEINIGGWRIEDEAGNFYKLSETSFILSPEEYFLFSSDTLSIEKYNLYEMFNKNVYGTSSFGFINSGELILLKDIRGNVIDSLWYSDKWHNKNLTVTKNRSLERINPSVSSNDNLNWNSSVDQSGATPGRANSILTDNTNRTSNISVSPNPFSPDEDGFEDFTMINYNLLQATSQIRIRIYDSKGRNVRTILNNHSGGSNGSVVFDGLDDEENKLRIGIYIILLESVNESAGSVENLKTVVVVAKKL